MSLPDFDSRYRIADQIVPYVPTIALVVLVLGALQAVFAVLGSLVTLSIGGVIGAILSFAMTLVGYAVLIMLHRIYLRVMGAPPRA